MKKKCGKFLDIGRQDTTDIAYTQRGSLQRMELPKMSQSLNILLLLLILVIFLNLTSTMSSEFARINKQKLSVEANEDDRVESSGEGDFEEPIEFTLVERKEDRKKDGSNYPMIEEIEESSGQEVTNEKTASKNDTSSSAKPSKKHQRNNIYLIRLTKVEYNRDGHIQRFRNMTIPLWRTYQYHQYEHGILLTSNNRSKQQEEKQFQAKQKGNEGKRLTDNFEKEDRHNSVTVKERKLIIPRKKYNLRIRYPLTAKIPKIPLSAAYRFNRNRDTTLFNSDANVFRVNKDAVPEIDEAPDNMPKAIIKPSESKKDFADSIKSVRGKRPGFDRKITEKPISASDPDSEEDDLSCQNSCCALDTTGLIAGSWHIRENGNKDEENSDNSDKNDINNRKSPSFLYKDKTMLVINMTKCYPLSIYDLRSGCTEVAYGGEYPFRCIKSHFRHGLFLGSSVFKVKCGPCG